MIDSPCTNICLADPESGLCIGCGRTLEEITKWSIFTTSQKKQLIKALKNRKKISSIHNNVLQKV